jgi:hypothetical protein
MKTNTPKKTTVQIFRSRNGFWIAADELGNPLKHYDYHMRDTLGQAMAYARKCGMVPVRATSLDRSI